MLGLGNKVQEIILLYEIQHIQDISRSGISRFWIQLGLGYLDLVYLDLGYLWVQGSQIQDIFRFRIYLDLRYIQIQDIARSRIYLDLGYIQIQDISRYEISCIVKCLLKLTNLLSSLVSSFPTQTHTPPLTHSHPLSYSITNFYRRICLVRLFLCRSEMVRTFICIDVLSRHTLITSMHFNPFV